MSNFKLWFSIFIIIIIIAISCTYLGILWTRLNLEPTIESQAVLIDKYKLIINELSGYTDTSIGQAISWIEHSRVTHQQFIDNPQFCTKDTGDVEFHENCVERYTKVLKVLRYYAMVY